LVVGGVGRRGECQVGEHGVERVFLPIET